MILYGIFFPILHKPSGEHTGLKIIAYPEKKSDFTIIYVYEKENPNLSCRLYVKYNTYALCLILLVLGILFCSFKTQHLIKLRLSDKITTCLNNTRKRSWKIHLQLE